MAQEVIPESIGGWAGYVIAAGSLIFTAFQHKRRAKIDESAGALNMWQGLANAHSAEIKSLTERLGAAEKAIAEMRLNHAEELATIKKNHAADLASRDDQIAGLVRMIAANSQSSAMMIGDVANGNHAGSDVARAYSKAVKDRDEGGGK